MCSSQICCECKTALKKIFRKGQTNLASSIMNGINQSFVLPDVMQGHSITYVVFLLKMLKLIMEKQTSSNCGTYAGQLPGLMRTANIEKILRRDEVMLF